jgi:hypothetical protein
MQQVGGARQPGRQEQVSRRMRDGGGVGDDAAAVHAFQRVCPVSAIHYPVVLGVGHPLRFPGGACRVAEHRASLQVPAARSRGAHHAPTPPRRSAFGPRLLAAVKGAFWLAAWRISVVTSKRKPFSSSPALAGGVSSESTLPNRYILRDCPLGVRALASRRVPATIGRAGIWHSRSRVRSRDWSDPSLLMRVSVLRWRNCQVPAGHCGQVV